jgi:hypothetical protein
MELERKQDLSIVYWLRNLFQSSTFIRVEDGFPETSFTLPVIAVERDLVDSVPSELGNRKGKRVHTFYVDIYALNKSQRDEIGYKIFNSIEDGIPVYDYDQGFPPDSSPPLIGALDISEVKLKIIKVISELTETLYWRSQLLFIAFYEET